MTTQISKRLQNSRLARVLHSMRCSVEEYWQNQSVKMEHLDVYEKRKNGERRTRLAHYKEKEAALKKGRAEEIEMGNESKNTINEFNESATKTVQLPIIKNESDSGNINTNEESEDDKSLVYEELYYGQHVFHAKHEFAICGFDPNNYDICLSFLNPGDKPQALLKDSEVEHEACRDGKVEDLWVNLRNIDIIPTAFNEIPSSTKQLVCDQEVMARYYPAKNNWFYEGKVCRVYPKTISVQFNDGDFSKRVKLSDVRTRSS
eukprot:TRINITY_DN773017_c0_g1_i1.p1 TRINITY_DN773017_c0_g1~~TRINITY_DN773017_c0_g1_i1.p1  ORF type:complete len:304 (+),score=44.24 TRINITY_DN773017_c0_g1_i1:130-912(+)